MKALRASAALEIGQLRVTLALLQVWLWLHVVVHAFMCPQCEM